MAAPIPPDIRLKLDLTLAQWRVWDCQPKLEGQPSLVRPLTGGLSNYTLLVGGEQKFVVRIDGDRAHSNRLSRATEWRVLKRAFEAGIAPRPCYFNPDLGALVCDYHEPLAQQAASPHPIAELLRSIHSLPRVHYKVDLKQRLAAYERQLGPKQMELCDSALRQEAAAAVQALDQYPEAPVLCHNDLLAANRLNTDSGLLAIDWEYCAMANRWFDVAVIAVGDKMKSIDQQALIAAYLKRPASAAELDALELHCRIYPYLEQLWSLANRSAALSP